jgi:hypothetical protein
VDDKGVARIIAGCNGAEDAVVRQLGGHVFEGVDDEVEFLVLEQHLELGCP